MKVSVVIPVLNEEKRLRECLDALNTGSEKPYEVIVVDGGSTDHTKEIAAGYDCTVLVSSHLLSEVELMANDIGILNHGRLLFEGTLDDLKKSAQTAGFPTDNLEDTFLAMIDEDNQRKGGAR